MERLFSPCTRMHDILESRRRDIDEFRDHRSERHRSERLQELNLDVSTEELLHADRALTYADLYTMLESTARVLWLTPHAAVMRTGGIANILVIDDHKFTCNVDGKYVCAVAGSSEELLEIFDVILRLLAASVVLSVELFHWICPGDVSMVCINATSLAYLMEQCQSLKALTLQNVTLDEDQIRVLGAYSRPELDIVLKSCKITSAGASALAEVLGRNQGPAKLTYCEIDNFVLANGLRGNNRLKSLTPRVSSDHDVGNREVLAIAGALKENKGLVKLDLWHDFTMSDETWDAVCDSLKTHPTLQVLNLQSMATFGVATLVPSALKSRIQALADMLKENISIHTIYLLTRYSEHELFRGSVIPSLETNRLRPRVRAIQKTRPIAYRTNVLGRALLAVRTYPNRFWMLLSGNPEVAFPSTTATTTPAVSLPTPATAAATSNAGAAVAASLMSAWTTTTTATGSLPTSAAADATSTATPSAMDPAVAAANVATPSVGHQKRKTCP
jgi:hypothetical protein